MMQVISSQPNQPPTTAHAHSSNATSGGEYGQRNTYPLEQQESISPASSRSGSPEPPTNASMCSGMGGTGGMQQPVPSATSADACMTIVHCLMCHRQGGESESFSKRAIESLVKKMKDKRDELDSLITAITSNGSHPTRCVTIQRTLDGRLQVAGRKGFPHVIYARIWRWPDLHKNELKHVKACQYAFDLKLDLVCVNPYHYERVVAPGIDLAGLSLSPSDVAGGSSSTFFTESNQQFASGASFPSANFGSSHAFGGNPQSFPAGSFPSQFSNAGNFPGGNAMPLQPGMMQPPMVPQGGSGYGPQRPSSFNPPSNAALSPGSVAFANAPRPNFQGKQTSTDVAPSVNLAMNSHPSSTGALATSSNVSVAAPLTSQPFPEYWCTIAYFELDQQVGEIYKVHSSCKSCTVDGYTDPNSTSRFCLGQLSNVHRTDASDHARVHIGKGIQLDLVGEGDVWLRCLSDHSVFVLSYYLDREAGRQPYEAVHKIYPTAGIKVFDIRLCYAEMKSQANAAIMAAQQQAAAVQGKLAQPSGSTSWNVAALAGLGVDDLRKLCVLRVSFVKGFGPDYARKSIKETPCWIEVQLNRPLQLLDEVLQSMPLNDLKPSRQFFTPAQLAPASSASAAGPASSNAPPTSVNSSNSNANPNALF